MNNVVLGNIAEHGAIGVEVAIVVVAVDEYLPAAGLRVARERIQQR